MTDRPDSGQPLVSVVVLCFNRPAMLQQSLASVAAQSYPHLEVLVVDNRSEGTEANAAAAASYPRFRFVSLTENTGFTGGMNHGISLAKGPYIYLTQDDVVLDRNCIAALVDEFERSPGATLASPLMIDAASGRIRCAGGSFVLEPVFRHHDLGAGEEDRGQFASPLEVTYIPGNMVFARLSELRELGGFRDDVFAYYDDVELCARVIRRGGTIRVIPGAKVYNLDPPVHREVPAELELHKLKNFFLVYLLHASIAVLPEFLFRYAFLASVRSPRSRAARLNRQAVGWVVRNLPRLLRDRRRGGGMSPGRLRTRLRAASREAEPARA
jgi:GT2 family glycosyltransferase